MAVAGMVAEIEIVTAEANITTNNIKIGVSFPTLRTPLNRTNMSILVFSIQGRSNDASNALVFKLS